MSIRQGDNVAIPVYLTQNNLAFYCDKNDSYFKKILGKINEDK